MRSQMLFTGRQAQRWMRNEFALGGSFGDDTPNYPANAIDQILGVTDGAAFLSRFNVVRIALNLDDRF